ncbi:bleomycin resistance protein [Pseudoxanthomonas japonensis]|uniref:bleomycin resistance protein n=1 Tax=Pseudoxanthomonas japonensis TaxID=69284 RepID=UPI003747D764
MTFRRLTPMLRTPDLPGTLAFYRDVLGFELASGAPEHGWLALRRDSAELMLSAPNDHEGDTAPAFTGSLYLEVADVDALWDAVRDHARVCYTPETFAYGMREFAIHDNNGYLLQFGTPVCDDA